MFTTIVDVYAHFCDLAGDDPTTGEPPRTRDEISHLIAACGISRYEDVDERFWDAVFGPDPQQCWAWNDVSEDVPVQRYQESQ